MESLCGDYFKMLLYLYIHGIYKYIEFIYIFSIKIVICQKCLHVIINEPLSVNNSMLKYPDT